MPEGHTVHRLARTFSSLFAGQTLRMSSPQGRFADGAAVLDGRRLVASEAWGKQLFLGFAPGDGPADVPGDGPADVPGDGPADVPGSGPADLPGDAPGGPGASGQDAGLTGSGPGTAADDDVLWLRTHLGLYGAWTFAGAPDAPEVAHAIGAPRKRIGERETAVTVAPDRTSGEWVVPEPRGQVRVRLLGAHAVADLTGPTACEVITTEEKRAVEARLGPDPIRDDADPEAFVAAVGRSRVTIGQQLMDQAVVAGVGNIYRAEVLFRAGVDPLRPGREVPATSVRAIWDDLVALMRAGATHGAIVTTAPPRHDPSPARERGYVPKDGPGEHNPVVDGRRRTRQNTDGRPGAVPADQAFYVYHRDGLPCRVCGSPVLVKELAGRNLFWCGVCQT